MARRKKSLFVSRWRCWGGTESLHLSEISKVHDLVSDNPKCCNMCRYVYKIYINIHTLYIKLYKFMIYLCIFQFDSLNKNKNWFFFLGYWFLFFVNKKKLVFGVEMIPSICCHTLYNQNVFGQNMSSRGIKGRRVFTLAVHFFLCRTFIARLVSAGLK